MPKPGAWMEVFERVMGFTLLATTVWLIDTLGSLTGKAGVTGMLAFLTVVALGCWIYGKWGTEVASRGAKVASLAAALLLSAAAGRVFLVTQAEPDKPPETAGTLDPDWSAGKIPWQPFSEPFVEKVRQARKPGFVDFTADW
jgi:thiol:disulfide interchange protein DsbD